MDELFLEVRDLSYIYKNNRHASLYGINLQMKEGEHAALLGSSGAGKTTLMKCISLLNKPQSGQVKIDNYQIWPTLTIHNDNTSKSQIAMIFQEYALSEKLSAIDNVLIGCLGRVPRFPSYWGYYPKEEKEFAFHCLHKVNLTNEAYQMVSQLSGGQRQRVAIARALAQRPRLVLADEPVSNLDPPLRWKIMILLKKLCEEEKITLLASLHFLDLVEEFTNRVIGIKKGRIIYCENTEKLTNDDIENIYGT